MAGFYVPTLRWCYERLAPGGIMAMHMDDFDDRFPMVAPLKVTMKGLGATELSTLWLVGTSGKPRPVWIWRMPST